MARFSLSAPSEAVSLAVLVLIRWAAGSFMPSGALRRLQRVWKRGEILKKS